MIPKPKVLNPRETYEQERVVLWMKKLLEIPDDAYTAVPLGELRDKPTAAKLQRMGVQPGCPDILFWVFPSLALEMKRVKGGRLSPEQELVHARMRAAGWDVIVAAGAEEAKKLLLQRSQFRDLIRNPAFRHNVSAA